MNMHRLNALDLLGFVGLTAAQWKAGLEIGALSLTILAVTPLVIWRWRALLSNEPKQQKRD